MTKPIATVDRPPRVAPLVGVTTTTATDGSLERARLNMAYVEALEAAGAIPVLLPPLDHSLAEMVIARVDGLVLTGGEDVDPAFYAADPHPALGPVHRARDEWELALARGAAEMRFPVLAICRGIQLLNVALGGTLVQDIPSEWSGALDHNASAGERGRLAHAVELKADSRLAAITGGTRTMVNSIHHQALARVADGLTVVGRSGDGLVEAAESVDRDWWVVAVQWHPEEIVRTPDGPHSRLFEAFVAAASARGGAVSAPAASGTRR